jgi:putative ABC transport system permease protein
VNDGVRLTALIAAECPHILKTSLERRPLKALMTSFGMGLAIAMLIVGFYFFDAFNYLLDFHFRHVQREDVMVAFNEPRSAEAAYNLAQIPGVLHAEPFRVVPARIRFEQYSKRTSIFGLSVIVFIG